MDVDALRAFRYGWLGKLEFYTNTKYATSNTYVPGVAFDY